jgi:hypothetical protein
MNKDIFLNYVVVINNMYLETRTCIICEIDVTGMPLTEVEELWKKHIQTKEHQKQSQAFLTRELQEQDWGVVESLLV